MPKLLQQAEIIMSNQDWSSAIYHLKELLLNQNQLTPTAREQILELALLILAQGDFQERWDVSKILSQLGPIVVQPLILIWEDPESSIEHRWFAGRILGGFQQPEVIISLVNVFGQTEIEELQEISALALSQLDKQAIPPLAQLLHNPKYQLLAARSLAQIRRPEIIEPFLPLVKASDPAVREIAIETLSSFHDPRIPPLLIEALQDLASSVRRQAVIGLGFRADLALELNLCEHLAPLLQDLSLEVCQHTARSLSKFPQDEAEELLFATLQSPHIPVDLQVTLIQALAWRETQSSLKYLYESLFLVSETAVLTIIFMLGKIKNEQLQQQAGRYLLDFFSCQDLLTVEPIFKQNLAYSWGKLQTISALPILEKFAQDDNLAVRLHAQQALDIITRRRISCP